jgi:hypothetical protein
MGSARAYFLQPINVGCVFPHVRDEGVAHRLLHATQLTRSRRKHAPNEVGNFCFEVTLSYRRLEKPRRAGDDWRQVR